MAKRSLLQIITSTPEPSHLDNGTIATMGRPRDIFMGAPTLDYDMLHLQPRYPLAYITMYQGMYMNLPWRFSVQTKKQEKYRRGISPVPLFKSKCPECGVKYEKLTPSDRCPKLKCKGILVGPDQEEYQRALNWSRNINLNNESIQDLMEMCAEDICVTDEGYIIFRKEYLVKNGKIEWEKVKETVWGSPIVVRPVQDVHTGVPGSVMFVCPGDHRNDPDVLQIRDYTHEVNPNVPVGTRAETPYDAPKCPKCQIEMRDVKYVAIFHERGHVEQYYIDGEVCHWHEYKQAHGLSVPPGLTLWISTSIITYKDAYIRDSFMKQRKPRGAVVVSTSNPDDFMNRWDNIMERTKNDWHYMPVIPFEPEPGMGGSGSNRIAWVDFMGTMLDLDYKEIREIYERQIYQFYGIGNIFANIETGHAGKGGTEAKLIISNRHIEFSNRCDNEKPLLRISAEIGLKDHVFRINPPEDRDVMKEKQLQTHELNNAQMRMYLGYEAVMDDTGAELSYRKDKEKELQKAMNMINILLSMKQSTQPPMMGGGMPGAPGGGGSTPKDIPSSKPKVNSNEFSGDAMGSDFDKAKYHTDEAIKVFVDNKIAEGTDLGDARQLYMGVRVELEHTDKLEESFKIAHDHLMEISDYYTRLMEMERKALGKAVSKPLGDSSMHEGNANSTKPSVNTPNAPGANPTGGYYAPDGKGPFSTKQALGGYMRSRDKGVGEKGTSDPGGDMTGPVNTKEDYLDAIKEVRKLNVISDNVMEAIARMANKIEEVSLDDAAGNMVPDQDGNNGPNGKEAIGQKGKEGSPNPQMGQGNNR